MSVTNNFYIRYIEGSPSLAYLNHLEQTIMSLKQELNRAQQAGRELKAETSRLKSELATAQADLSTAQSSFEGGYTAAEATELEEQARALADELSQPSTDQTPGTPPPSVEPLGGPQTLATE